MIQYSVKTCTCSSWLLAGKVAGNMAAARGDWQLLHSSSCKSTYGTIILQLSRTSGLLPPFSMPAPGCSKDTAGRPATLNDLLPHARQPV